MVDQDLHYKQVEAYYTLLMKHPGRTLRVPIPLRGEPLPSQEDYDNSVLIWQEARDLLKMMGVKHDSFKENLGIRIHNENASRAS